MITLRLTAGEARALINAAGNTMYHEDAVEAIFPHPSSRAAARRAFGRLKRAYLAKYQADPIEALRRLTGYCEDYRAAGCEEMDDALLRYCRRALKDLEEDR